MNVVGIEAIVTCRPRICDSCYVIMDYMGYSCRNNLSFLRLDSMSSFACPLCGLFCHCPNCYIIMTMCHALCFTVDFQEVNDEKVSFLKDQISPKDKPTVNHAKYRLKQAERVTIKK